MGWFTTRHFDGVVKIAGVQVNLVLKSDYDRIWNENTGEPFEYWHYHFEFRNKKMEDDDAKGIKTKEGVYALPEYRLPYMSETGYRSDFFQYFKKPKSINTEDIKEMIEGRVTMLLGKNTEIIKSYNQNPVEIISDIPEKSWEVNDEKEED